MFESLHAAELGPIIQLQQIAVPEIVMKALSNLGPSAYLLGLIGLIYLCFDTNLGARLLLVYFAGETVSYLTKLTFHSPRPFWMDERVQAFEPDATSYGLPSGHSLVATCVWFLLAGAVRRSWFWAFSFMVVVLISLSRVWLGAHFISDVAAGWFLGGLLLLSFLWAEGRFGPWLTGLTLGKQILLSALGTTAIVAVGFALHAATQNSIDPAPWPRFPAVARSFRSLGSYSGTVLGLSIGLAMAARWARFDAGGHWRKRILRVAMVAAPAMLYWLRPRNLLKDMPDLLAFTLLLAACAMAAWAFTFLVPWLFLRIGLAEPLGSAAPSASSTKPPCQSNLP